jgi:hypothetical protein
MAIKVSLANSKFSMILIIFFIVCQGFDQASVIPNFTIAAEESSLQIESAIVDINSDSENFREGNTCFG